LAEVVATVGNYRDICCCAERNTRTYHKVPAGMLSLCALLIGADIFISSAVTKGQQSK